MSADWEESPEVRGNPQGETSPSEYLLYMGVTLVSIRKITDSGGAVLFHDSSCRIFDKWNTLLAEVPNRMDVQNCFME